VNDAAQERVLDIAQQADEISHSMEVTVRVMVNEEPCTINMQCSCNARVADIIDELSELTTEGKYKLSLVRDEEILKRDASLVESKVSKLLCLKGGDHGPKAFMRF
jgi:hypothetical protein